jgi:hypothetical protein
MSLTVGNAASISGNVRVQEFKAPGSGRDFNTYKLLKSDCEGCFHAYTSACTHASAAAPNPEVLSLAPSCILASHSETHVSGKPPSALSAVGGGRPAEVAPQVLAGEGAHHGHGPQQGRGLRGRGRRVSRTREVSPGLPRPPRSLGWCRPRDFLAHPALNLTDGTPPPPDGPRSKVSAGPRGRGEGGLNNRVRTGDEAAKHLGGAQGRCACCVRI